MADGDSLATLGEKLTDLFVGVYASGNPNVSVAFLPFSTPVPDDIVQAGVVNPLALTQFLAANFDAPYLISPADNTAHGKDTYYGTVSEIYATAVTVAQSAAPVGSDTAKRVNAEIAIAQTLLNPAGVSVNMTSEPDDWVLPGNTAYWTVFDSSVSHTAPPPPPPPPSNGGSTPPVRVFNPALWSIRSSAILATPVQLAAVHQASPAVAQSQAVAAPVETLAVHPSMYLAAATTPSATPSAPATSEAPAHALLYQRMIPMRLATQYTPSPPPPPSSSVSIHFEYMSVTIGYMAAGIPVINKVFLADRGWYIAGLQRGALLPDPDAAQATPPDPPLLYGLPTALIIARNVTINVKWAGGDQGALGSAGGFLGPFSLSGISPATQPDGSFTYASPGMQVIALICDHLPVLPPIDAPDLGASASAPAVTPPAGQPNSTPSSSTPPSSPSQPASTPTPSPSSPGGS